jgi:S1-C subfamily serine protease
MRPVAFLTSLFLILAQAPVTPTTPANSIVQLRAFFSDGTKGSCSGVSVQEEFGNFLTSDHCIGKRLELGGQQLMVIRQDPTEDIALVSLQRPSGIPAIRLGKAPMFRDKTEALGFAFQTSLLLSIGTIFQGELDFEGAGVSMVFIGNTMAGMSGGAIVNDEGKLVSLVKGGGKPGTTIQVFGLGVRYKAVKRMFLQGQMN